MNRMMFFVSLLVVAALTALNGCGAYKVQCYRSSRAVAIEFFPTKTTVYVLDGYYDDLKAEEDTTNVWTTQPVATWASHVRFAISPSYPYGMKVAKAVWRIDDGSWKSMGRRSTKERLAYGFVLQNRMDGYHTLEVQIAFEDLNEGDAPEDWVVHTVRVPIKLAPNRKAAQWDHGDVKYVRSRQGRYY